MRDRIDDEITFRKLEVLLAFMQTGSLAKAAEVLNVSTVSVHRALHSLETMRSARPVRANAARGAFARTGRALRIVSP